jgi:anthranilate phosphoribosyltransferase
MINTELNIRDILNKISSKKNLTYNEAILIFKNIVEGRIQDYDSTSILKEISVKGETGAEILAMIQIIKEHSIKSVPKSKIIYLIFAVLEALKSKHLTLVLHLQLLLLLLVVI